MAMDTNRSIDSLRDDEIVEAIARCGIDGVHQTRLPELLGIPYCYDTHKQAWDLRLIIVSGFRIERSQERVTLSLYEWSQRLANKNQSDVLALLEGKR